MLSKEIKSKLERLRRKLLISYLSALYRFYPARRSFEEYELSYLIQRRFNCRKILDLGCGRGNLAKILGSLSLYVGIDLAEIFEIEGEREYVRGSMEALPIRDGKSFDCAFFVNSIFYSDWEASMIEAGRVARRIVIIDIDKKYPHIWLLDAIEGRIRKRPEEVKKRAEKKFRLIEEKGGTTFALVFENLIE